MKAAAHLVEATEQMSLLWGTQEIDNGKKRQPSTFLGHHNSRLPLPNQFKWIQIST